MAGVDTSSIIIALVSGGTGMGGAWFVLRGKKVEVIQHGTEWLVDQLRKDAEEARKDAEAAKQEAKEAKESADKAHQTIQELQLKVLELEARFKDA